MPTFDRPTLPAAPHAVDGAQIKEGRTLLRWTPKHLATAAKVRVEAIERAERSTGELPLTIANATAIRRALEAAGVEFTHGDQPNVRLTARRAPAISTI
jgi:hypothetical protein